MIKNKKILVVGASGLLGSSLVKSLLINNEVLAIDINIKKLLTYLSEKKIYYTKNKLHFYDVDITNDNELKEFFNNVHDIDGVVNCSYPRNQSYGREFLDVERNDFNDNLNLNLGSSFSLMQESAKSFRNNKRRFSFVNIASIYGVKAPNFELYKNTKMTMPVEYAAIKSSLIHLSAYITKYINDSRFRINCISPGGILDKQPENFLSAYTNETLGKGMLDPNDIIGSILFLLSDYSEFINGQNIIIDDGFTL